MIGEFDRVFLCDYNKLLTSDIAGLVYKHGMVRLVNHVIITKQDLVCFADSLGEILEWEFGAVNELKYDVNSKNYLYSEDAIPFHWDGAFYKEPGILIFHCVNSGHIGPGGETLFADTKPILETLSNNDFGKYKSVSIEYFTDKVVHYGGSVTKSIIDRHPVTKENILRYAEEVTSNKNPVLRKIHGLSENDSLKLIRQMKGLLYDNRFCYQHQWCTNDLLLVDNHRFLHGRNKLKENTSRYLRRVQVL